MPQAGELPALLSREERTLSPLRSSNETIIAYKAALMLYRSTLILKGSKEFERFYGSKNIWHMIQIAKGQETHWRLKSFRSKWFGHLRPMLTFMGRYSKILDSVIPMHPFPTSLVVGGIKLLLGMLEEYTEYHVKIIEMLSDIGEQYELLHLYIKTFDHVNLSTAVLDANTHLLTLLSMANGIFTQSAPRVFFRSILKPLLIEFDKAMLDLDKSIARAASWVTGLNAYEQMKERQDQRQERAAARQARADQVIENTLAKEERLEQGQERHDARQERSEQTQERREARQERWRALQQSAISEGEKNDRLRHKVMKYLSRADSSATYRHALAQQAENPTSCKWIFKTPSYKQWQDLDNPCHSLWIYAGPGTGKTVLTAQIAHRLEKTSVHDGTAVLHFFCIGVNAKSTDSLAIMRTLLCQLLDRLSFIPSCVLEFYGDSYRKGADLAQSLTFVVLQRLFCFTLEYFQHVHIIVDGIDEVAERKDFLLFISQLGRRGVNESINILITSRRESDISQSLQSFCRLPVHASDTQQDIESYIRRSVSRKLSVDAADRDFILTTLQRKSRGMFIWARLVIDILRDAATRDEISTILSSIPQELHEIYCVILEKLFVKLSKGPETWLVRAQSIFKWLALAVRPVRIPEIQEALALEGWRLSDDSLSKVWDEQLPMFRPNEKAILDVCGVLIDETEEGVRLLHHTFREFLLSGSGIRSAQIQKFSVYANTSNANINETCLIYLCLVEGAVKYRLLDMQRNKKARSEMQTELRAKLPLYEYACQYWPAHFIRVPPQHNKLSLNHFSNFLLCVSWYQGWSLFSRIGRVPTSRLFHGLRKHGKVLSAWLDLLDVMLGGFLSQTTVSLEEIAAYTEDAPSLLSERFSDPSTSSYLKLDVRDLAKVAERGHFAAVRWILKRHSPDYSSTASALRIAAENNHEETVWIVCDYLIDHFQCPRAIDLAAAHEDKVIENLVQRHVTTIEENIEVFHRTGTVPLQQPSAKSISSKSHGQQNNSERKGDRNSPMKFEKPGPSRDNQPAWIDRGDHFAPSGHFINQDSQPPLEYTAASGLGLAPGNKNWRYQYPPQLRSMPFTRQNSMSSHLDLELEALDLEASDVESDYNLPRPSDSSSLLGRSDFSSSVPSFRCAHGQKPQRRYPDEAYTNGHDEVDEWSEDDDQEKSSTLLMTDSQFEETSQKLSASLSPLPNLDIEGLSSMSQAPPLSTQAVHWPHSLYQFTAKRQSHTAKAPSQPSRASVVSPPSLITQEVLDEWLAENMPPKPQLRRMNRRIGPLTKHESDATSSDSDDVAMEEV